MYKKILVPLDGSELAECVFPHVKTLLEGFQMAEIFFVRVLEPLGVSSNVGTHMLEDLAERERVRKSSANKYLSQFIEKINQKERNLMSEILVGRVTESLAEFATKNDIDLILIATHGRSGVTRWVRGSVADKILRSANIPVLMVRAPGTKGGI